MPTQKKFGLRSVRPLNYVVAALHDERAELYKPAPTRYCVRRVTPKEEAAARSDTHVAYLCNEGGNRLSGVTNHYFTPRRYSKRLTATTNPAQPVAASDCEDGADEHAANSDAGMDLRRRPSSVAIETGVPDDVMVRNAGGCNPQV